MTTALQPTPVAPDAAAIEALVIGGDLAKLTPAQRVSYYHTTCRSLGLNPLTRPFEYITLNGKLTLYARKDATDQLRAVNAISIEKPEIRFEDEWIIVTVSAHDANGRTDADVGVVNKTDMRGDFGNALMKAVTKAKRRVTLSICGLGMLDETEVATIPTAAPIAVDQETGELVEGTPPPPDTRDGYLPNGLTGDGVLRVNGVTTKDGTKGNKPGGEPWRCYFVTFSNGREAATFSASIGELAFLCRDAKAPVEALIEPHKTRKGKFILTELRRLDEPAPQRIGDGEEAIL